MPVYLFVVAVTGSPIFGLLMTVLIVFTQPIIQSRFGRVSNVFRTGEIGLELMLKLFDVVTASMKPLCPPTARLRTSTNVLSPC
jgi:hypothetical protein